MEPRYTATEIARAAAKAPRVVRRMVAGVEPAGCVVVNGKPANAWSLDQLPRKIIQALEETARRLGAESVERLLANPPRSWEPTIEGRRVSLSDIAPHCLEDAKRLQQALAGVLPMAVEGRLPREEIEAVGLRDYKAVVGHEVSAANWWKLVERTIDRDGGAGEFDRLEIYLADKLARKQKEPPAYSAAANNLHTLKRWIEAVKDRCRPTNDEALMVWHGAFLEYELLTGEFMVSGRKARTTILHTLERSGVSLAKGKDALRAAFYRKLKRWLENGRTPSAIEDKRPARSGHRRAPALPEEDRRTILARCVENGGRLAQGWRECLRRGELSFETTQRFIHNPGTKSHVPRVIREAIGLDPERTYDIHHSEHQHKGKGSYNTRDYTNMHAGDQFSADDLTQNHMFVIFSPTGKKAIRGQILLFIDVRSNRVIGYAFHPERNYNSRLIRESIRHIHRKYGFPRDSFFFEKGYWKAKLLIGDKGRNHLPLEETEMGLSEFCKFKHANGPKSKGVVERIIGILQNEMESLPGYVGRNSRTDRYDRIEKLLRQADSGKIPFEDFIYSFRQIEDKIREIIDRYNDTPQTGKLKGLSPNEAWEKFFNWNDPLIQLPKEAEFLLANHRKPMKVTRNGIRLTFKGESWWYRNFETGARKGEKVLVWYETDEAVPDFVTITDLNKENPVLVPKEIRPAALNPDPAELSAAIRLAESHNSYARTLYRVIEPRFTRNILRHGSVDASTNELGERIETQKSEHTKKKRREADLTQKVRQEERARGIQSAAPIRDPEKRLRAYKLLEEADEEERIEKERNGS